MCTARTPNASAHRPTAGSPALLDYLTIAAASAEMRQSLLGARVQDVLQVDRLMLGIELYADARWYFTLSADCRTEGIALNRTRVRRGGGSPTPLTLAARARLIGSRLSAVEQPAYERVLSLAFEGAARTVLVGELMGRLANIVLVDESGTVIAAAHQVTAAMTSARVVLPGRPYQLPPAPGKLSPPDVAVGMLADWLRQDPARPAWRVLTEHVRAVSPLAAREIVARAAARDAALPRAGGAETDGARREPAADDDLAAAPGAPARADAVQPEALLAELHALYELPATGEWQPGLSRSASAVTAYAPYRLFHLPGWHATATTFEAIDAYERERAPADPYGSARDEVRRLIGDARERASRRLAALERERPDTAAAEAERLKGDLILAYQREVIPGQTVLAVRLADDEPELVIAIDPALTAVENAGRYYKRYRRARRAAAELPALLEAARGALATLDQLAADADLAEDRAGIDAVYDALLNVAPGRGARRRRLPGVQGGEPLRVVSTDGFTVLVGRNSRQNEVVTFTRAKRGDLWLHARDLPGGHVVIKAGGRPVPQRTRSEAAALAAYYSRARGESSVPVAVVDVRHVRRMPGGGPGMVIYDHADTLTVAPRAPQQ